MRRQHSSVDGFTPRRSNRGIINSDEKRRVIGGASQTSQNTLSKPEFQSNRLVRSDIDESLHNIDDEQPAKKLTRRQRRELKKLHKKALSKNKRIVKWAAIIISALIIIAGCYLGFKFIVNSGNIFQGNFFDIFSGKPLKTDANGRSNFLILGTSEDDPGHGGADLTDSMIVVSIDQSICLMCHATSMSTTVQLVYRDIQVK
jgi:cobalamin biosynthesis Co2+ chelatase CbiK